MRVVAMGVDCVGAPEEVDFRWEQRRSAEEKTGAGGADGCVLRWPQHVPPRPHQKVQREVLLPLGRAFIFDMKNANTKGTRGSIKRKFC